MNLVKEFNSGMRLAYAPMPNTKSLAIGVYVRCGSANEREEENGISHFIEHMLFKGTQKRDAFAIAEVTEAAGVQINAFTSKDVTSYYTLGTLEHAELCMDVLSDLFFHAVLDEGEMEREKGVVISEIHMGEDAPEDLCYEKLALAAYGNTGLGRPITGTPEHVRAFTRERLQAYMARYYTPQNTVIAVAGGLDYARVEELVLTYFESQWGSGSGKTEAELCPWSSVYSYTPKPIAQANVAFAFPAYGCNDARTVPLSLISNVLGGGMSSRLFRRLREELGLVYEVYTVPSDHAKEGHFSLYFATSVHDVTKAVAAAADVLRTVRRQGITSGELQKGKEQLKAGIVLGSERSVSVMRALGRSVVMDGVPFDVDARLSEVEALTLGGVNEVLADVLQFDNVSVAYVGKALKPDLLKLFCKEARRKK